MPKVSDSHRAQQVTRILRAAELCFARHGFDGASMDEIIAEAGMSSSTVYRYFPQGKCELVRAILGRTTDPLVEWIKEQARAEDLPGIEEAFIRAVEYIWSLKTLIDGPVVPDDRDETEAQMNRIDLQMNVWAELARRPDLREANARRYGRVRAEIAALMRRWQERGEIDPGVDPDEAAAIVHNAAMGLLLERAITGESGRRDAAEVARALGRLLGAKDD